MEVVTAGVLSSVCSVLSTEALIYAGQARGRTRRKPTSFVFAFFRVFFPPPPYFVFRSFWPPRKKGKTNRRAAKTSDRRKVFGTCFFVLFGWAKTQRHAVKNNLCFFGFLGPRKRRPSYNTARRERRSREAGIVLFQGAVTFSAVPWEVSFFFGVCVCGFLRGSQQANNNQQTEGGLPISGYFLVRSLFLFRVPKAIEHQESA